MSKTVNYDLSVAPVISVPRSRFNLSHRRGFTMDFDYLVPFFHTEVYPGDTFTYKPTIFGRLLSPLDSPIMDNMYIDWQSFYVPMWHLWTNTRKFFGQQDNPGDSIAYTIPQMTAPVTTGYVEHSLADYLRLPTKKQNYTHSALYHRTYTQIYNHWYRDQNLIGDYTVSTADGPDTTTNTSLLKRGKRFNYFTSLLTAPQKSTSGAVDLPLGTTAPVVNDGTALQVASNAAGTSQAATIIIDPDTVTLRRNSVGTATSTQYYKSGLEVDLSSATAATIIELRTAERIQQLLEMDARAGTRYSEINYAVYGVRSPDLSYRPEFLGSGSTRVNVQPVPQTSNDGTNGAVANLSAYATFSGTGEGGWTKSFTEHGIIMSIMSARADLTFSQGLERIMSRSTRYDYLMPILQGIGDQTVYTIEIYCDDPATDTGSTGTPNNQRVFGYQEKYAELKYIESGYQGYMRSNATGTLDSWHLGENFSSVPALNQTFIESNTPIDRVKAISTTPDLIVDVFNEVYATRPMALYSIPGMGARF